MPEDRPEVTTEEERPSPVTTGARDACPKACLRLNKFLAERIGVSRREADDLIKAGKVKINDKPAELGARLDKSDKVWYNGNIIPFETDYLYIAMNKPVGYVCSRRAQGDAPTIYELLPKEYQKLKTVGRLDKDSSGLILLTNDGDFAFQHTHPKFKKEKIYEVELDKPLEPLHQQMISDYGIMLDDGPSRFLVVKVLESSPEGIRSAAARVQAPAARGARPLGRELPKANGPAGRGPRENGSKTYLVKLSEGRNRQIRRTFAALGYKVTKLHRTNFGLYQLSGLKPGKYVILEP
ncbi:rRNA pseudouridine synthase [Candidatus Saccharibacteria bacterium]|nr:rRNA pseudouridine synthase [Candidatus Saccharibacteria bacterium]